ncbi:MAG: hypothetical protein Q8J65_03785 [Nitrosomonadales bacterium]|nr:hypothetical protein [Nitrosomonadales bacterium]
MMDYFRKLPGFRRSPSGLEWRILKKLPLIILLGTIIPTALVFALYWSELLDPKLMDRIIIFTIGLVSLHWSFMITIGIAAFIVMLMKGPAYVADPYYPPDFNDPDDDEDPLRNH